MYPWFVPL
jgi:WD40 repeat protein